MGITATGLEYETVGTIVTVQGSIGTGSLIVQAKLKGMDYASIYTFTADDIKLITLPSSTIKVLVTGDASYAISGVLA